MPKKTIIIFIIVFAIVGGSILGYYYIVNKKGASTGSTSTDTTSGYQSFNPFGSGTITTTNNIINNVAEEISVSTNGETLAQGNSKFTKLTDFSVAGATYFEDTKQIIEQEEITVSTKEETTTPKTTATKKASIKKTQPKFEIIPSLRYVERANGHIYQMTLSTKKVQKISNSTIPSIYEAFFDNKALTIIYRYLSSDETTINSYLATLGGTKGEFLISNILDLSISPDKTKIFYLVKNSSGIVGSIKSFSETKISNIFSSPFTEWISQWVTPQKIFLTTKASWNIPGNLFSIITSSGGTLTKVLGGVEGLTTLANGDGTLVLYNATTSSGPKLGVFNIARHTTEDIKVYGLPEKCIWANDKISIYCALPKIIEGNQFPDSWYQGLISFDDYFVKINTNTNQISTISDSNEETSVDATKLFLNKEETKLFFINKKDSTLWSLDLE